ncbi:MAG: ammonia-forming cytochrome c nitrite reductase subunit c552 [Syntrophobacter sp.]
MNWKGLLVFLLAPGVAVSVFLTGGCSQQKAEPVKTAIIGDGEMNPANWGKAYPLEYDSWVKTKDPRPVGKTKYKNDFDEKNAYYDKLSEYPFMPLLFNGWGFGIEYNEPRGHHYMVTDQVEIDQSRTKAGGACLTCKSPYVPKLKSELGASYFSGPYAEVRNRIPAEGRDLGAACMDCHENKSMGLRLSRWTLTDALKATGKNPDQITRQEARSLVCAQCHVTYIIPKDKDMKSTDVFFPWQGSKQGDISIENIIKVIRSNPAHGEWKQNVTGFKVGYIRHPEYEFYSRNSVHSNAGAACADCHMPYMKVGSAKISDHNVMGPLKNDLKACQQCHSQTPEWLSKQVFAIQDRTVSMMNRAGYAAAVAAKLFETAHKAQEQGKTLDQGLYDRAKDLYLEAFYRVVFMGAENSIGFHNPAEAGRICGDAISMANKSEALLRQVLVKADVEVPADINLEIAKYVNERGTKKLKFRPELEFADPFGIQPMITPVSSLGK